MHDPAALEAASRIRTAIAPRVHRLGEPDEITEDSMPKMASTEPKPEAPAPKKRGRKPGAVYPKKAAFTGPRFGVFDDGSVTLNLPGCKGQMVPQEAREFLAFLGKIGVKA